MEEALIHGPSRGSLGDQAYHDIRRMIVRLELAPGAIVREDKLQQQLGTGRTPIREALQRLVRDQFVTIVPRRGVYVSHIDVSELSTLYETRAVLEPYASRLACTRGDARHWSTMRDVLGHAHQPGVSALELIEFDRRCHEIIWEAADNRFLTATLEMLYAQSDRLWHMYLADVDDMGHAVEQHVEILDAFEAHDIERSAALVEAHIRAFDEQIRGAVHRRLESPLATT